MVVYFLGVFLGGPKYFFCALRLCCAEANARRCAVGVVPGRALATHFQGVVLDCRVGGVDGSPEPTESGVQVLALLLGGRGHT
eukprot:1336334-Amphidinium_carterae.1